MLSSALCRGLVKIKFYQFEIFGKMNEENLSVDKPSPIINALKLESGLYRDNLDGI